MAMGGQWAGTVPLPWEKPQIVAGSLGVAINGLMDHRVALPSPAPRCTLLTWSPRCTTRCGWRLPALLCCRETSWPPSSATWPCW